MGLSDESFTNGNPFVKICLNTFEEAKHERFCTRDTWKPP